MDWIRRNWPDLLIGIALIAVIAGIVVTLLSGGSLLPFGQRQTAAVAPAPPTVNGSSDTFPSGSSGGQVQAVGPAGEAASGGVVIPVAPGSSAAAGPAGAGSAGSSAQQAAGAPSGGAPANIPAGATSYRISVAAVRNANSANQLAGKLKTAGYPAFVGQQGDLSLVLVGPYADRSQASATATKLNGDGYDTLIYTYEGQTAASGGAAASGAAQVTTSGAPSATASGGAAAATTPAPTSISGTYLQVGAYATSSSAQPQIQHLQQLGYTVTQRQEGGLIKLLIGPFGTEQLTAAESQLQAQGIDFFPRH